MSSALKLIRHALGLLTQHPLQTVRVVAPGLLLMVGVAILALVFAPGLLTLDADNPDVSALPGGALVLIAAFVLSYALMAVLWHRHTLRANRAPKPMSTMLIAGYLWRVSLLAVVQLLTSLALVLPLSVAAASNAGGAAPPTLPSILITTFVLQLVVLWVSLRLSLILPAAALGYPIRMVQSWYLTARLTRTLWGVSAVLALINTLATASLNSFWAPTAGRTLVVGLPIYILEGLLIFSILTTLYAQLIQKKRLAGL
ncbi:hypothetical protein KDD17_08775 [Sulfitobacter albidus]|uniref:Uncharacterized protein n=1 Tax=Sulfitobacter albidus TaxID=2829501 RepID=A0A975PKZ1_9RHOB|nr:hypothetical protein [Sulfitobacter albidus]QUJ75124.1 hypothetical protein KDD17_08775 [Sulfitobacter albidus]